MNQPSNSRKRRKGQSVETVFSQIELLNLAEVRLLESHCRMGEVKPGELPDSGNQSTEVGVRFDDKKQAAFVRIKYGLFVGYDGESATEATAAISVRADFGVKYTHREEHGEAVFGESIGKLAVMNSWPFWREFVQSTVVRMGFPLITIPLLSIEDVVQPESAKKRGK